MLGQEAGLFVEGELWIKQNAFVGGVPLTEKSPARNLEPQTQNSAADRSMVPCHSTRRGTDPSTAHFHAPQYWVLARCCVQTWHWQKLNQARWGFCCSTGAKWQPWIGVDDFRCSSSICKIVPNWRLWYFGGLIRPSPPRIAHCFHMFECYFCICLHMFTYILHICTVLIYFVLAYELSDESLCLYYLVLYYIIVYYIILSCLILYYIILYLYYIILYCILCNNIL